MMTLVDSNGLHESRVELPQPFRVEKGLIRGYRADEEYIFAQQLYDTNVTYMSA